MCRGSLQGTAQCSMLLSLLHPNTAAFPGWLNLVHSQLFHTRVHMAGSSQGVWGSDWSTAACVYAEYSPHARLLTQV
jgi:hypothetical protein